ncbi:SDR family oxidoreductase [Novosphingobium resinovorum]|jgi:short-subunit dehydrogenase|uniref:Short-chain dehydrogenase n=1 Tax=Novosphingobium resinovorum TaxID=158500 RepID=A0A031JXL1_9SPHN|nr:MULTISPECIES: SDR family oxidoreductase [Sphingomonadaceae]AOR77136.1 short-chain dehydrogenase [Novosphingobium resinovorum]EJU11325.1 short-chain dehydrogenase/reductase SDR [Sphingomonas sp. LH128]EZP81533.1 Short-chain dehydrogenase/reductase SDR [Novosphingobium resinovorum]MBF7012593.1 SDR family oxidoreductase [Novosphingobium sp. HR1a]WJM27327.1 SDR family oxidoreductase [Novosphingobium resinovorum]
MAGRLQDKICIITGAGSGMGRAMARLFHTEGAKLLLADISGKEDEVAADLGGEVVSIHCDVSSEAQVKTMIARAEESFGRLDVLCNNAGFGGGMAPLHTQTTELWDKVHATNIRGVFLGMKYGIESMLKTGGGAIVNTSSASAVIGWKHHSVYSSAKAGVHQLTKVAALDYSDSNIRVNAVAPGTMWTGLVEASKTHDAPPEGFPTLAGIPMGRWGRAEDIALAALFLASDEAAYITGVILPVDGGYSIGFSGMGAERPGIVSANSDG